MRILILVIAALVLSACKQTPQLSSVISTYRIDIQQGNVVTQEMVNKLKAGQTRSQVRFVLGSPLVTDMFHQDRWDYVYLMQRQGKPDERRRLTVIFDGDKLVSLEGDVVVTDKALEPPPSPAQKSAAPVSAPVKPAVPAPAPKLEAAKPASTPPAAAAPPAAPITPPAGAKPEASPEMKPETRPDMNKDEAKPAAKAPPSPAPAANPAAADTAKTDAAKTDAAKPDAAKTDAATTDTKKEESKRGTFGRMLEKIGF
jgi:outer membrane protein assembly factor BamE